MVDDRRVQQARAAWQNRGDQRPSFAQVPGPGQESVWDYPRPPRLVDDQRLVEIFYQQRCIVSTERSKRVLETAHPPSFYIPTSDVDLNYLLRARGSSFCEWKGEAEYFSIKVGDSLVERCAWSYRDPFPEFSQIRSFFCFYPHLLDCFVNGEKVKPQPGGFYGGWITSELVGPFKGEPGSQAW